MLTGHQGHKNGPKDTAGATFPVSAGPNAKKRHKHGATKGKNGNSQPIDQASRGICASNSSDELLIRVDQEGEQACPDQTAEKGCRQEQAGDDEGQRHEGHSAGSKKGPSYGEYSMHVRRECMDLY